MNSQIDKKKLNKLVFFLCLKVAAIVSLLLLSIFLTFVSAYFVFLYIVIGPACIIWLFTQPERLLDKVINQSKIQKTFDK